MAQHSLRCTVPIEAVHQIKVLYSSRCAMRNCLKIAVCIIGTVFAKIAKARRIFITQIELTMDKALFDLCNCLFNQCYLCR
jgi:hypothetical protein